MDSLTHIVLGAAIQTASLGKVQRRKALLYGGLLATLPDLDVLSRYADPVSSMTYHRGATHSVLYLSLFALLLAVLIRRFRSNPHYSGMRLFVTIALILLTHTLLDALTVYGTQIFYPFSPPPASFSALFIIDPLFTLPLLLVFVAVLWRGATTGTVRAAYGALAWCVLYLAFGTGSRLLAEHRIERALTVQGIHVAEVKGVPLPLNNLVWRVLAKTDHGVYCEGVSSIFDRKPPETLCINIHPELAAVVADHPLYQRLHWFTDGWLRYDVIDKQLVVSDLRMGTAGEQYFRFVLAKQASNGTWQNVTPYRYQDHTAGASRILPRIWQRILSQSLPLLGSDAP